VSAPDPAPAKVSTTAKVGLAVLLVGLAADGVGVKYLFWPPAQTAPFENLGAFVLGLGCLAVGSAGCALGGLVAGGRSWWRRGGERGVGLLGLAAVAVAGLVLLKVFKVLGYLGAHATGRRRREPREPARG
jgi:hypothetical protein